MSRVYERPKFWPSPTPIKGYHSFIQNKTLQSWGIGGGGGGGGVGLGGGGGKVTVFLTMSLKLIKSIFLK